MKSLKTIITSLRLINHDVMEIGFKIKEDTMDFIPGQFISVKLSTNPFIVRPYSVLRYDRVANEVYIGVKRVAGGVATSRIYETFRCGMEVEIMGAMGDSLIVDKSNKDIVLVATGIGITPILCVLEDLVNSKYNGNIELVYGNTTLKELYYLDKIEALISNSNNIKLTKVISREEVQGIRKGYVTDVIKEMDLTGKYIYMCSSNKVASSLKDALVNMNFDLSKFSCESA